MNMTSIWKCCLINMWLLLPGCRGGISGKYKQEGWLIAFLKQEHVPLDHAFVYFIKAGNCPCIKKSLSDLEKYKGDAGNAYIFADFDTKEIPEIKSFRFKKTFIYEDLHYEKSGLFYSTPKIFIVEKGEITLWREY